MFRKKNKYLLEEGQEIEIHFNENGFDNFLIGKYEGMDPSGVIISNDNGVFFVPMNRIMYFQVKK